MTPAQQQAAARQIVDALPERRLSIGEALAILAIVLEVLGQLDTAPPQRELIGGAAR